MKQKKVCNHYFIPTAIFRIGFVAENYYEVIREPILVLRCSFCDKVVYSRGNEF